MGKESLKITENGTIRKRYTVSYSHSIVTMALSCIISKIKRYIGDILKIAIFLTPPLGGWVPVGILPYRLVRKKIE